MRILIATNQLERLSGSEVVALEFAESFVARGCEVTVFANWAHEPMLSLFREAAGIDIVTEPLGIRPLTFDLVYFQHQVAGLFDYSAGADDRPESLFVFGRLSRRTFLESGGWAHDDVLGDLTLANSELTAERLAETGVSHPVSVFYNGAPGAFFAAPRDLADQPRSALIVSNHRDPAILDAAARLRNLVRVTHIGRSGDRVVRVDPAAILEADVVVTIGKTVQYALAARTPVFVYDHFGGPGYLNEGNFAAAARYSFSGRCCERRLDGAGLASEILSAYPAGRRFARCLGDSALERFQLDTHVDRLLATAPTDNTRRRDRMAARRADIERERMLAAHLRRVYVSQQARLTRVKARARPN